MRALGERWNARVLVIPGEPRIVRGPYRWIRHPNYLAVLVSGVALFMLGGLWYSPVLFAKRWTALVGKSLELRFRDLRRQTRSKTERRQHGDHRERQD